MFTVKSVNQGRLIGRKPMSMYQHAYITTGSCVLDSVLMPIIGVLIDFTLQYIGCQLIDPLLHAVMHVGQSMDADLDAIHLLSLGLCLDLQGSLAREDDEAHDQDKNRQTGTQKKQCIHAQF